ncbi:MAG TPA: tetratricopeptide repeat protein [bacterium]|nr:tetratricopeptide repeat protein [bacterium]
MSNKHTIAALIIIFLMAGLVQADLGSAKSLFNQANKLYDQKKYEQAIDNYQKILDQGYESGNLYYNLGNAFYKTGQIGNAILYYEKARSLLPDNENIEFNLRLARLKIQDKIDRPPEFVLFKWGREFIDNLSSNSWALILSMSLFLVALAFAFLYLSSRAKLRSIFKPVLFLAMIVAVLSIYPLYYQHTRETSGDKGIILSEKVNTIAAPQKGSTTLFIIHEGTKVQILDRDGQWVKIELLDGKQGWIHSDSLGII